MKTAVFRTRNCPALQFRLLIINTGMLPYFLYLPHIYREKDNGKQTLQAIQAVSGNGRRTETQNQRQP